MNANVYGESYSYHEYLADLSLTDRIDLVKLCKVMLGVASIDILRPFEYQFSPINQRLVKFIHERVLWKKPAFSPSQTTIKIDSPDEVRTISNFCYEVGMLQAKGIKLFLPDATLQLGRVVKHINLNNKSIRFFMYLMYAYPNILPYTELEEKLGYLDDGGEGRRMIKRDFFNYLKSVGYSEITISKIRNRIIPEKNLGYKLV